MTNAIPIKSSQKYGAILTQEHVSELELMRMIKDMKQIETRTPCDPYLKMILGIALFRKGQVEKGLDKLSASVAIHPTEAAINNYVLALRRAEKFKEALCVHIEHAERGGLSLFDIVLSGDYSDNIKYDRSLFRIVREIADAELDKPLTTIARKMFKDTVYGSNFYITTDYDEGGIAVNVVICLPLPIEAIIAISNNTTRFVVKNFRDNKKVLMQIFTTYKPLP